MHVRFATAPELGEDVAAFAVVRGDRTVIVIQRAADLPADARCAIVNTLMDAAENDGACERLAEVANL